MESQEKAIRKMVDCKIRYMANTGLNPVSVAHMIITEIASFLRYDPEASSILHRAGYHLCQEERDIAMGKTPIEVIFGTWPGDETDAELLAALKEIRA